MDTNRRDFLVGAACAALAGPILPQIARGKTTPRPSSAPKYVLQVLLSGGVDSVYTTDPKTKNDVKPGIDVPYSSNEIVSAGGLRLGPHFAELAHDAGDFAIVNGVRVASVSHLMGFAQFWAMRNPAKSEMPSLLSIIGDHRDPDQPIGTLALGALTILEDGPSVLASADQMRPGHERLVAPTENTILSELELLPAEKLHAMAQALRGNSRKFSGKSTEQRVAGRNLVDTAAFLDRLISSKRFQLEEWSKDPLEQTFARNLQRALWAFENNMCRSVMLRLGQVDWDTHYSTAPRQERLNLRFARVLKQFLAQMRARSNEYGGLLDNSLIIIGSEMGRFPRVNTDLGKDHFPEVPLIFIGKGINTNGGKGGLFGQTGRNMEALPISHRTGRVDNHSSFRPELVDVGTTLLRHCGIDPEPFGYYGKTLEFLA